MPSSARILIWERGGAWALALRGADPVLAEQIVEIRSRDEANEELATSPHSVVLVEAAPDKLDAAVDFLVAGRRNYPCAVFAVLGERGLARYEWLLREAGAETVCLSPRRVSDLATIAARHLARAPVAELDFASSIAARLPWRPAAQSS